MITPTYLIMILDLDLCIFSVHTIQDSVTDVHITPVGARPYVPALLVLLMAEVIYDSRCKFVLIVLKENESWSDPAASYWHCKVVTNL